jgi:hypothetical protein
VVVGEGEGQGRAPSPVHCTQRTMGLGCMGRRGGGDLCRPRGPPCLGRAPPGGKGSVGGGPTSSGPWGPSATPAKVAPPLIPRPGSGVAGFGDRSSVPVAGPPEVGWEYRGMGARRPRRPLSTRRSGEPSGREADPKGHTPRMDTHRAHTQGTCYHHVPVSRYTKTPTIHTHQLHNLHNKPNTESHPTIHPHPAM